MKHSNQCPSCRDTNGNAASYVNNRTSTRPRWHSVMIPNFVSIFGISPIAAVTIDDYARGGFALRITDHDGPLMTATAWTPGIPPGHVAVKDYPDMEGCLDQLVRHRVVEPPAQTLNGFPICRLGTALRG